MRILKTEPVTRDDLKEDNSIKELSEDRKRLLQENTRLGHIKEDAKEIREIIQEYPDMHIFITR